MTQIFPRYWWSTLVALGVLVFMPKNVIAQANAFDSGIRNIENAVLIVADPPTPVAGDTVHLTAESPLIDLAESDIVWNINGAVFAQGVGKSEIDVPIDETGKTVLVDLAVDHAGWGHATKSMSIQPIQLDLLYDAPTYVPPFYRGRAMPSMGSTVRFQAIARFPQGAGYIDDALITYTWAKNGRVLGTLSGLGKSVLTTDAPSAYGNDTVSVQATAGTLTANAKTIIAGRDPHMALYQVHPLFGTMFHAETLPVSEGSSAETTFAIIPYFADITGPEDPNIRYQWSVNDTPIGTPATDRSKLIVRTNGNSDPVTISVSSINVQNIFMSAIGKWRLTFSASTRGTVTDTVPNVFKGTP